PNPSSSGAACARRRRRCWPNCAHAWPLHDGMRALLRWAGCLVVAGVALQLFFVARIAAMALVDPQSTAFQRSEAWQIAIEKGRDAGWRQEWVPYSQINDTLKRAVIATEDAGFVDHDGVEWEAIERARQRNAQAEQLAARRMARAAARGKTA